MTPVTKQAWIDALRSGKYKQAQGMLALVGEDGCTTYCCLGVLAVIAGATVYHVEGDGRITFDFDGSIEDAVVPLSMRDIIVTDLDLNVQMPTEKYGPDELMRVLSTKNDLQYGGTFEDIATYLEKLA